uniref:Biliverdin reductase A n=1 Tax=Equus caballus TaxID=9796 RepID=A0A9L0SAP0_HORSE
MNAEPERKFGVVVVGVGRAGSVRIRDLRNPHPSSAFLNLIGFVSRRELGSVEGVPQISLEDALSSQEVEVAYICSENSSHEDYIRQFLNAGKHVLVEYPMTLSWAAARDLWDLAEQKGRVLHEEHVELLMEEFAFLKKEVVGKDLLKGSLLFTAGPLEQERFGFPAFSGISRLTWLVSLFGELSLVSATLEQRKEDQYMKMTVCLETENKRKVSEGDAERILLNIRTTPTRILPSAFYRACLSHVQTFVPQCDHNLVSCTITSCCRSIPEMF